jgi:hypothetical protein
MMRSHALCCTPRWVAGAAGDIALLAVSCLSCSCSRPTGGVGEGWGWGLFVWEAGRAVFVVGYYSVAMHS